MPGLLVRRGNLEPADGLQAKAPSNARQPEGAAAVRHTLRLGDWLEAKLVSHDGPESSVAAQSEVVAMVDGYLTAVDGASTDLSRPAAALLALYRESGTGFLNRLRGSFIATIVDLARRRVLIFNDRRASRPCFYRTGADGSLTFAPETALLALEHGRLAPIDYQAVTELLIFGSYFDDRTLFSNVRKLPPASCVELTPNAARFDRYWQLRFDGSRANRSHNELVDECADLVRISVRRHLARVPKPVLLLSGGTDSRIILASMLAEGLSAPAASYGTGRGDDVEVATRVAQAAGISLQLFTIPTTDPSADFVEAALESDCRAESIDTPSLRVLHRQLAESYDGYINGDECFGWKKAHSPDDAFRVVGLHRLSQASRLLEWIAPDQRRPICGGIDVTRERLQATAGPLAPGELKDWLYYHSRLGNMLNSYTGGKLRYYEQVRPLIDEDLIDFAAGLPTALRNDKALLRDTLKLRYPELYRLGFTTRDSLPTASGYQSRLPHDPAMRTMVHNQLVEQMVPLLAPMFEHGALRAAIGSLVKGTPMPLQALSWWQRLPGVWRVMPPAENRVPVMSLVLRLLQVQLFLTNLAAGDHQPGP